MDLKRVVANFRNAIEACQGNLHLPAAKRFPCGACGEVSHLLAKFLRENYGIETTYNGGWIETAAEPPQHHAWLEFSDQIIDITADQFPGNPSVIVCEIRYSDFHSSLQRKWLSDRSPGKLIVEPKTTGSSGGPQKLEEDYWHDYHLILEAIES